MDIGLGCGSVRLAFWRSSELPKEMGCWNPVKHWGKGWWVGYKDFNWKTHLFFKLFLQFFRFLPKIFFLKSPLGYFFLWNILSNKNLEQYTNFKSVNRQWQETFKNKEMNNLGVSNFSCLKFYDLVIALMRALGQRDVSTCLKSAKNPVIPMQPDWRKSIIMFLIWIL